MKNVTSKTIPEVFYRLYLSEKYLTMVKKLIWSFAGKKLTVFRSLIIFAKNLHQAVYYFLKKLYVLDVWLGSEYAHDDWW